MNEMLSPFLLTTAIIMSPSAKGTEQVALKAVFKASYKQSGMAKTVKYAEKKYINEDLRYYGGYAGLIFKIITERKISYEFKF